MPVAIASRCVLTALWGLQLPGPLLSIVFSHLSAVDCARLRMALRHAQEVGLTKTTRAALPSLAFGHQHML